MRFDRAGLPFVAGALAPAAVLAATRRRAWAWPFVGLAGFFAYFFRDPDRVTPQGEGLVISPADGRVIVAGPAQADSAPAGRWQQVSIFLSPLDVHINRAPVGGRVRRVAFAPGRFLAAYRPESARLNERTEIWIQTGAYTVVARQVVGALARRIVCRVSPGMTLAAGERIGLMKFGSRMDVFIPREARLLVSAGDKVRGGESVIAELP